jgi:hypothetical protein
MYDADSTQDSALTTEQIANAGNTPSQQDVPAPTGRQAYEDDDVQTPAGHQAYQDDDVQTPAGHQAYQDDDVQTPAGHQAYEDDDVQTPTDRQAYEDDDVPAPTSRQAYEDDDVPAPAGHQGYQDDNAAELADHAVPGQARRDAPYAGNGASRTADPGQRARLLEDGELQGMTARWKDIQAEFVEEPTVAVQQADALVAELMQRLAVMFAAERAELETRLAGGNEVSTEDLRQGLRRYRSFFERLLAA